MRIAVAALICSTAGCKSTTVVDVYRESASVAPQADEAIVVLGRRHAVSHNTEEDFVDCVGRSLRQGSLNVIPEKQFVDSMYPYFETSTAPTDVKNLDKLVQIPAIAAKLNEYRVRYFIWVDGATETVDKAGSITCAIGPGGGGCFGFAYWEDEANYEASVWDFKNLALSGKISAETQGTSFMPAVVIPIPLLARVQSNACKSMATQIQDFLK